jgi:hypothetical protein
MLLVLLGWSMVVKSDNFVVALTVSGEAAFSKKLSPTYTRFPLFLFKHNN